MASEEFEIESWTRDFGVPSVSVPILAQRLSRIKESAGTESWRWYAEQLDNPEQAPLLLKFFACSGCAAEWCFRYPDWLPQLERLQALNRGFEPENWPLDHLRDYQGDDAGFDRALRQLRNQAWLCIVWRDLNRLADTLETCGDLSRLAELCLQLALDYHSKAMLPEVGEAYDRDGNRVELVVLGMGKLGAEELNLSSDIDLMFTYASGGETQGGRKSLDNQQYFIRLGQRLIKSLDQQTADGFVFRVDMRLRPYGQSGPLAMSFDAMEQYFEDQGREWERYAMIKARCVAGDIVTGQTLMDSLAPFVFRRYIDFSAIDSLREMKRLIRRETQRRKLDTDIKLGPGGIREIEFIGQCFQLIRGGQEHNLRGRALLPVLSELAQMGLIPESGVLELVEAYRFLRDTEHAIQAWGDRQTQQLPQEDAERAAVAWAMHCDDWEDFEQQLDAHRRRVTHHFEAVIAEPEPEAQADSGSDWDSELNEPDAQSLQIALAEQGFDRAEDSAAQLLTLLNSSAVERLQSEARKRLMRFLPMLLDALPAAQSPSRALDRILPLVEAVLRRTAYLVLVIENPQALRHLVRLCDASIWISKSIAAHPVLLDELLDSATLFSAPGKTELRSELRQQMLRVREDDEEARLDTLRYFKLAHVLRIAASEVAGTLPLMKVSDYLSFIAEVILEQVLELVWDDMEAVYGRPDTGDESDRRPFIIVAYGKLGGIELSYGSDLDLVFIHDGPSSGQTSGSEKSIDNMRFYTRLGQRLINALSARTHLGDLYEVDMRLRPSGNSGLLVSSRKAFITYQQDQAWTWERQALVRARVVAGDPQLAQDFYQARSSILAQQRDNDALKQDVLSMRQKMRDHLLKPSTGASGESMFDLKQSPGGIVDIEFMVQYAVLAWAHKYPALTRYSDNIRILEALSECELWRDDDAKTLIEAYIGLRSLSHKLSLQQEKGQIEVSQLRGLDERVTAVWRQVFE